MYGSMHRNEMYGMSAILYRSMCVDRNGMLHLCLNLNFFVLRNKFFFFCSTHLRNQEHVKSRTNCNRSRTQLQLNITDAVFLQGTVTVTNNRCAVSRQPRNRPCIRAVQKNPI